MICDGCGQEGWFFRLVNGKVETPLCDCCLKDALLDLVKSNNAVRLHREGSRLILEPGLLLDSGGHMIERKNGFLPTCKFEVLSIHAVISIREMEHMQDCVPAAELTLMSGEPIIVHGPYAEAWLRYGGGLRGEPADAATSARRE